MMKNCVNVKYVADAFGVNVSSLDRDIFDFLENNNFNYEIPVGQQRDKIIIDCLREINEDKQVIGVKSRTEKWHDGWKENLDSFVATGSLEDIKPKFIRPSRVLRFRKEFIIPEDSDFEKNFVHLIHLWVFRNYILPYNNIYEFGCGSGFNIIPMALKFPEKNIVGTDFVQSSVDLIREVSNRKSLNRLSSGRFDMINPDMDFDILPDSCVFTFGAIEQLASKFDSFVKFLCIKKPGLCFHIEPTFEFYDSGLLVDYLSMRFYGKRGYSKGFLPLLQKLESKKSIEIIKTQRLMFGNDRMEGYNLIAWRPI